MDKLQRRELYELVWSKPRTQLAKHLGVSDVMIGKLCRQLNVPAPPPGYWAHIAAGGRAQRRYAKPPLTYTLAERVEEDHATIAGRLPAVDPATLDIPIPPFPDLESEEEAVRRYEGLMNEVALPKASRGTHSVVQKLVAEDERRAGLDSPYSLWDKPRFAGARGQRLLGGLNLLLWWWTDLGFRPSSSGVRHIKLYAGVGSSSQTFEVDLTAQGAEATSGRKAAAAEDFQMRFDMEGRRGFDAGKGTFTFSKFDLDLFRKITLMLIREEERRYREWIRWRYDHVVSSRAQAVREAGEAAERERQRVAAEERALRELRKGLLDSAIDQIQRAESVRALVAEVETRVGSSGRSDEQFTQWRSWALSQADEMDLRTRPKQELLLWIERFQLGTDGVSRLGVR